MICRNGVQHEHETVAQVRECYGVKGIPASNGAIRKENIIPQGPKPAGPNAKRNAERIAEQDENTRLANQDLPHGFTSHCPLCVAMGAGHPLPQDSENEEFSIDTAEMQKAREELHRVRDHQEANPLPKDYRTNMYAGECVSCGNRVEPEAGMLAGKVGKKWNVKHLPGQCPDPETETDRWKRDETKAAKRIDTSTWPNLPAGYYAIPSATGNNDLDFFRLDRPDSFTSGHAAYNWIGHWEGRTYLHRVIGGHSDKAIAFKLVGSILNRIIKYGAEEARAKFAETFDQCQHCGRSLTDELSRKRHSGPDCFEKFGW